MNTSRWERFSAVSGLAFVGLVLVSFSVVPVPPKLSDLEAQITYLTDNRTGLILQMTLATLAVICLLWFAGTIRSHLLRNEGSPGRLASTAFAGSVGAAVTMTLGIVSYSAAAIRADSVQDPAVVRVLTDFGTLAMFVFFYGPAAVWIGATALVAYRHQAFLKSYAVISGTIAALFAAAPALMFGTEGFFSIDEPWGAGAIGMFILLLWIGATSVMLIVGEAAPAAKPADQPHEGWHLRRAVGH